MYPSSPDFRFTKIIEHTWVYSSKSLYYKQVIIREYLLSCDIDLECAFLHFFFSFLKTYRLVQLNIDHGKSKLSTQCVLKCGLKMYFCLSLALTLLKWTPVICFHFFIIKAVREC